MHSYKHSFCLATHGHSATQFGNSIAALRKKLFHHTLRSKRPKLLFPWLQMVGPIHTCKYLVGMSRQWKTCLIDDDSNDKNSQQISGHLNRVLQIVGGVPLLKVMDGGYGQSGPVEAVQVTRKIKQSIKHAEQDKHLPLDLPLQSSDSLPPHFSLFPSTLFVLLFLFNRTVMLSSISLLLSHSFFFNKQ